MQLARHLALALLLVAAGLAWAQPGRLPRVGVLANTIPTAELVSGTATHPAVRRLVEGLRERGWVPGRNLELVWRSAEGDLGRLPALAVELAQAPVDVLVAYGPGVGAAIRATDRVPIVMATSGIAGRVVVDGVVRIESLARPGGNVTGLTLSYGDSGAMGGKLFQLVKSIAPRAARLAVLTDGPLTFGPTTSAAAKSMGLELSAFDFGSKVERLEPVFDAMAKARVEAVLIDELPATNLRPVQERIHRLAERHRVVAVHRVLAAVDTGGLMAYGPNIDRLYDRAPYFVDRILRGTKPGDIPIEQPGDFELRLNLGAARAIGLEVPREVLLQATRVIE